MSGPRLPSRRSLIKGSAAVGAIGALQLASPFIISARGEVPIRIGMIDPLTGSYAAVARSEVEGAKLGMAEVNKSGGVLGRQVELLVEDSANDVGTGVQKAHKLFERDHVDVLFGDVNSAIALALAQVSSAAGKLHIVTGGHTDGITGKDCHWNVFRVCNTTYMDAAAVTQVLVEKLGKKWFFLTPDYAYGHTLQAAFVKLLTKLGGTYEAALAPIGTNDFSAYLIKARASGAKVLIDLMGGGDQVVSIKQFTQFGLNKQMALGGALFELEVDPGAAGRCAHRLVDDGVVPESAGRAARRRVRREHPQGDRQDGDRAPLVRLRGDAQRAARGRARQEHRRRQDGARAGGDAVAA